MVMFGLIRNIWRKQMSKSIEVTYYSTPRHGYFAVKGEDLRDLKISQSFSEYSYYNEDDDIFGFFINI